MEINHTSTTNIMHTWEIYVIKTGKNRYPYILDKRMSHRSKTDLSSTSRCQAMDSAPATPPVNAECYIQLQYHQKSQPNSSQTFPCSWPHYGIFKANINSCVVEKSLICNSKCIRKWSGNNEMEKADKCNSESMLQLANSTCSTRNMQMNRKQSK